MRSPVLLVVSAVANVAMLAALAVRPSIAPESVRDFFSFGQKPLRVAMAPPSSPAPRPVETSVWSKLETADLRALVEKLRAAGFPASVIRAIVAARIEKLFAPRFREIADQLWSPQFWKSGASLASNSKLYEQMNSLYRERSQLQRSLLGDDSLATAEEATAQQRQRYGDLSKTKIDLVRQVEDDYAEMTAQVRAGMQGIVLPEDKEKLALLEREKHADLASILSPDELADYEMRTSTVTTRLRPTLTLMDATDQEFRTIYAIEKPLSDALFPAGGITSLAMFQKQREVQKTVNEQLKTALGDRYADFVRAGDSDYQQLYRVSQLNNVPVETANQAYALRSTIGAESVKIANDAGLSADEKRSALQTLGQNARMQLTTTLGEAAGTAYADSARWLKYIENGGAVSFNADGTPSYRAVRPQR